MSLIRCPDCNKVISTRFPMHDCVDEVERAQRTYDRLVKDTAGRHDDPGVRALLVEAADDIVQLKKLKRQK